ncbi:PKD domain-containing protein [Algoriphagus antarcticus]|uniref:Gliding motility-associated-like protein n=1 Tax=Algoriphagus antarcticus TaxID=238540 RepID=A0A3E0DXB6_9BACT|nr:PKD domain-containing protein [Algoriphagus antarcticus]REG90702.1 gliding motility-associated-like protein [Algoriphagus antarcticus]
MVNKLTRGIALGFFLFGLIVSLTILGAGRDWLTLNPLLLKGVGVDPVADFTFSPNGNCANVPVKFTNASTGNELTYEWDFGDGKKSTSKDPTHTFSSATGNGIESFDVKLTVKDKDEVVKSVTKTINVKEIPSLNLKSDQAVTTFNNVQYFIVCDIQSSEFTFYNAEAPTENNILYEIDWGDGSPLFDAANWTELKHAYSVGIYNITYTVTPSNGCKVSRKFGVFIGSNPSVGLGTPGNTNVCVGEELTFPISVPANNPDGTIYTVNFSDGSPPEVFTHPPPASVSHIFTDGSCGSQGSGLINFFSVTIVAANPCSFSQASVLPIYVSEPAVPEIEISSDVVCVDETVKIENITDFTGEVSINGSCNVNKRFVWEIFPETGWTLSSGSLGNQPNPSEPNSWTSGSEVINPTFTIPGTYTVKLMTGNRCGLGEETKTIVVIPKPEPSFTLDKTEVCGPATVKATNTSNTVGIPELSGEPIYTWSISYTNGGCGSNSGWAFASGFDKNSESPSFIFNKPGIYTIALTITVSCGSFTQKEKVTITAPPAILLDPMQDSCGPTTFTPKATVSACGSDTPTYKWTFEGGTPSSSTSLDPGPVAFSTVGVKKIMLEVTSGCGTTIAEKTFSVANPPKIDIGQDQEICKGVEIELKGLVTEGSGKYSYKWTNSPSSSIAGSTAADIKVKPNQTTTYTLTVSDQDTQCITSEQVVITVNPAPTIQFSLPDQEICSGESIQAIALNSSPSGESFTWTAEANGASGVTVSGTNEIPIQTLTNTTGEQIKVIYTALIPNSSQGNCTVVPANYTVIVNPEPSYLGDKLTICSGEGFDFKPSGVVSGSKFTWTVTSPVGITGATNSTLAETSIKQQLQNSTNTPLDVTYTVTPTIGTCTGQDFALLVTIQPAPSITFSEEDQNLCTGSESKEVKFTSDVSGATFTWTADPKGVQGVTTSGTSATIPVQSLINPTRLPITVEYKVSVKTSSGGICSGAPKTYRITVNPSITIAEDISDFSGYQISCFSEGDGFIKLNPSGGNGVFAFSWTGPNGFTSANSTIENLTPGIYQVKVEDEFGCSLSKSFEIKEPTKLTSSVVSTTDVLCAGDESGAIELAVTGGVEAEAYQFDWIRNGVPFPSITQNLSAIPAGTYDVTIFDANGCSLIITGIEITEPAAAIVINYTKTDISCYGANDGSLDLDVSGGLPPYTINWSFGSSQSGFDNLGPGDYTLTVSDQSGCIRSQTITIEDAPLFRVDPEVNNITCFGAKDGIIKLDLQGGFGATTIRWDHGAELEDLFNLSAGFYAVTIKDQTDCEIRSEFNIVEPALLAVEPKITDALACDNPQSGEILLGISGGTPPYAIKWSNGQTSGNLLGITSGQYAATITDASGCTINKVFEVKRPPGLAITAFQSSKVQCEPRFIEDEINITISGGIAPYSISWSGGLISADQRTMTTTEPGYYEVTVVDRKGCVTTQSFDVENTETIAKADIESAAFDQYNSYLVNFEIQFWNRSFGKILTYHWDFGDGSESFDENPKHTYAAEGDYEVVLTVTDVFGCPVEVRKKISVFDYYLVVPNVFTPNGDGINDYFFPRFVGIESLEFWVLNKWGETIYHTVDLSSQGWDGNLNREPSIPGNYVYKLRFKTLDGRTQTITDLFMLLK